MEISKTFGFTLVDDLGARCFFDLVANVVRLEQTFFSGLAQFALQRCQFLGHLQRLLQEPQGVPGLWRRIGLFAEAIASVALKIREGAALWSALEETGLFPDLLIEMVKVGESSGSLAEMLEQVAEFTDQEIERELQTLVSLIEPLVRVFMALIIAVLLLAIYYPLLMLYANAQF